MTTPAHAPPRCAKCGAEVVGRFCADCGSAAKVERDLSVKHFLREAAAAITDVDSVLIASFRDLVVRPGALTASYFAGERHRYLPGRVVRPVYHRLIQHFKRTNSRHADASGQLPRSNA